MNSGNGEDGLTVNRHHKSRMAYIDSLIHRHTDTLGSVRLFQKISRNFRIHQFNGLLLGLSSSPYQTGTKSEKSP